jgi:hypothetical protein
MEIECSLSISYQLANDRYSEPDYFISFNYSVPLKCNLLRFSIYAMVFQLFSSPQFPDDTVPFSSALQVLILEIIPLRSRRVVRHFSL